MTVAATAAPEVKTMAPGLSAIGVTKRFGSLVALDDVSMTVRPGTMHALLGGNGAGKSTLVKCIMGYYLPDVGQISLGDKPVVIRNPRQALSLGIGMVYQHFTLVPNMTVAENLVLSRGKVPGVINWKEEYDNLRAFMRTTPFFIPIGATVRSLAAGQKQKLEICKQLYLKNKVLFLDEPTSVLTPGEADELLTMLKARTSSGELTVCMITHKFREVMKFADEVTVLRTGKFAGKGLVKDLTPTDMSAMMIGSETTRTAARDNKPRGDANLQIQGIHALDDIGLKALEDLNLNVHAGEIVGIAGVSGNGQSKLVEVLAGQRKATEGGIRVHGEPFGATRAEIRKHNVNCLPEEPLKNTCVGNMSVAQNMVLRNFDRHPHAFGNFFLNKASIRRAAQALIDKYRVKTPSPETPIRNLSGGNVQRAVLARELSDKVEVLIAANPCFGLDFAAAAEIRAQIMEARNRGAAVLLVSEDLDEVFELSDRIIVMFHGKFVYETPAAEADISIIGRHMAGTVESHEAAGVTTAGAEAGAAGAPAHQVQKMTKITALPNDFIVPQVGMALIVIDMQRDFIEPGGFGAALGNNVNLLRAIIPATGRLIEAFRRYQLPIIHTKEGHKPDLSDCPPAKRMRGVPKMRIGDPGAMGRILILGEPGNDIIEELYPMPGEIILTKPGKGAFCETDLDGILKKLQVTHLAFAGVTTEVCVQTTMREANDRGYECLLVEDCTESYFPAFKAATLEMVRAQGGIVGWTAESQELIRGLEKIHGERVHGAVVHK